MTKFNLLFQACAISFSTIFLSCNHNKKEPDALEYKTDSLVEEISIKDESILEFITVFNEVESNLDSITQKQHSIFVNFPKGDIKASQKERIDANIKAINELMTSNRKRLSALTSKLKADGKQNKELMKTIDIISNQLIQKDCELEELNKKLINLNTEAVVLKTAITSLIDENKTQANTIQKQKNEMQTSYFVVGTRKYLTKNKIIDSGGGFLGIGKTSKLESDLDKNMFSAIDYTEVTVIPINADDIKIVTIHPADSYTFYKEEKSKYKIRSLIITNPDKFWSTSKYLVIVKG